MQAKGTKREAQDAEDQGATSPKYERPPPRAGQIPKQAAVATSP